MALRLINDIIKPWEELNSLLVKRFAYQPDLSDVTRMASSLAVSIKHQADLRGVSQSTVDNASFENRLMSDVADAAKHGQLRNAARNNKLYVASYFQYAPTLGFRFIRNSLTIAHGSMGEHDFMVVSLAALRYWMNHIGFSLGRELAIAEGPNQFFPSAYLYFNPRYCINMTQTRLKFFEKLNDGSYQPIDPHEIKFEVVELPGNSNPTPE